MTIDRAIVQARLRLMRDLLDDLDHVGEVSVDRFQQDRIVRHAVERILTQLVDLSVSINSHIAAETKGQAPATYRESFSAIAEAGVISPELAAELAPSAGLRNILTHEYVAVDLKLVVGAVPLAYRSYQRYVTEVARYLASLGR
ncbi:MAG: type VII toxin-antitoxin system HepT family RNase toxin [Micromonosporaceae bacterium]